MVRDFMVSSAPHFPKVLPWFNHGSTRRGKNCAHPTVLAEQASMERTIDTVHDIAVLLASYDTQGVADMLLAKEGQLPGKMHRTLGTMEQNLRKVRKKTPPAEKRNKTFLFPPTPVSNSKGLRSAGLRNKYTTSAQYSCIFFFFSCTSAQQVRSKYAKWGFQEHQKHCFFHPLVHSCFSRLVPFFHFFADFPQN